MYLYIHTHTHTHYYSNFEISPYGPFQRSKEPIILDANVKSPEDLHLLLLLLDGPLGHLIRTFGPLPGPGSPATSLGGGHQFVRLIFDVAFDA